MDTVFTYSFYGVALLLLGISFVKDKSKTILALKRAGKMFVNVAPQFMAILLLTGLLLAIIKPKMIEHIIGAESGFMAMLITSLLGAIMLIPAVIAFPIGAELLRNGAGVAQIVVFISTLTTVGLITLPLEAKYLGKKLAIIRNAFSYLLAFLVAYIMGAILL